jgi:ribosomal protein S18 acetylase RimI-like enzyme
VDINEEWIRDDWHRPRFDVATDTWIVTAPGGDVVAAAYTWDEEPGVLFDSAGWVRPDHRGRGLGTALMEAVERRATRDAGSLPAGSVPTVHQSFDGPNTGARVLFEGRGYAQVREFLHMQIDVGPGTEAGDPPDGIEIRPRRDGDDPAIFTAVDEAFRAQWGYRSEPFDEWIGQWRGSATYDPALWLVALDGGRIVGAMLGDMHDTDGWVSTLAVSEGWRRRGIAGALLKETFALFGRRGVPTVMLNVDRDNTTGATRLYERAGMRLRRSWIIVAKTLTRTV